MNLIQKLDRLVTDKEYKIIIKNNSINIINYKEIKDFTTTKIIIATNTSITTITGNNLTVSRMQDNEIFITGKIKTIEL